MQKKIQQYFDTWLRRDRSAFDRLFAENVVYSECYGPEYHGLGQIKRWFDDWNTQGRVLEWRIKAVYVQECTAVAEWYFCCDYRGNVAGFDGVSIVQFDGDGKIVSIKEFQSRAEHEFPYE